MEDLIASRKRETESLEEIVHLSINHALKNGDSSKPDNSEMANVPD
jgi:hypothetical protein